MGHVDNNAQLLSDIKAQHVADLYKPPQTKVGFKHDANIPWKSDFKRGKCLFCVKAPVCGGNSSI